MTFTRKLLAMLLCVALVASLAMFAGCGEPKDNGVGNDTTTPTTTAPPPPTDEELILGSWKGTYDITDAMNAIFASNEEMADWVKFENLTFDMVMTYNADGTFTAKGDADSVKSFMESFKTSMRGFLTAMYNEMAVAMGMGSAEELFTEAGMTLDQAIDMAMEEGFSDENLKKMTESFETEGIYELEDGKLYSAEKGKEIDKSKYETYEISADTLKLLSYVGDTAVKDDEGNDTGMSIDPTTLYPITFTKVK